MLMLPYFHDIFLKHKMVLKSMNTQKHDRGSSRVSKEILSVIIWFHGKGQLISKANSTVSFEPKNEQKYFSISALKIYCSKIVLSWVLAPPTN